MDFLIPFSLSLSLSLSLCFWICFIGPIEVQSMSDCFTHHSSLYVPLYPIQISIIILLLSFTACIISTIVQFFLCCLFKRVTYEPYTCTFNGENNLLFISMLLSSPHLISISHSFFFHPTDAAEPPLLLPTKFVCCRMLSKTISAQ